MTTHEHGDRDFPIGNEGEEVIEVDSLALEHLGDPSQHHDVIGEFMQRFAFQGWARFLSLLFGKAEFRISTANQDQFTIKFILSLDVVVGLPLLDQEQRGLGDIDMPRLDQRAELAEDEGEQKGADMRSIDIGIGHQDDLAVT